MNNLVVRTVLGTIAFWIIIFFSPILIYLFSSFSYGIAGTSIEDSILGVIIRVCCQSVACLLAILAMYKILFESHYVAIVVNSIIAIAMFVLFIATISEITRLEIASYVLAIIACIRGSYYIVRKCKKNQTSL